MLSSTILMFSGTHRSKLGHRGTHFFFKVKLMKISLKRPEIISMCLNCVIICGFISSTYVPQFWQNNHIFFKISGILKVKSQVLGMIMIFFSFQDNKTILITNYNGVGERKKNLIKDGLD